MSQDRSIGNCNVRICQDRCSMLSMLTMMMGVVVVLEADSNRIGRMGRDTGEMLYDCSSRDAEDNMSVCYTVRDRIWNSFFNERFR